MPPVVSFCRAALYISTAYAPLLFFLLS
jgi:hypothetical protein